VTTKDGIPVTTVERTFVDLTNHLSDCLWRERG
jgi:hypothetical protein